MAAKRDRTEYHRKYQRKRRAKAAKEGRCVVCALRKPAKGMATCRKCLDARAKLAEASRASA